MCGMNQIHENANLQFVKSLRLCLKVFTIYLKVIKAHSHGPRAETRTIEPDENACRTMRHNGIVYLHCIYWNQ